MNPDIEPSRPADSSFLPTQQLEQVKRSEPALPTSELEQLAVQRWQDGVAKRGKRLASASGLLARRAAGAAGRGLEWLERQPRGTKGGLAVGTICLAALLGLAFAHSGDEPAAMTAVAEPAKAAPAGELPALTRKAPPAFEKLVAAQQRGDLLGALAVARGLPTSAGHGDLALLAWAEAAVAAKEPLEALEVLERAVKLSPAVAHDERFVRAAVQTFAAGRAQRTQALLAGSSAPGKSMLLGEATRDWTYRVRHGAADALKRAGQPVPDEVALWTLDGWQSERCDVRRAAFGKLRAKAKADERAGAAVALLKKRDADGCLVGAP